MNRNFLKSFRRKSTVFTRNHPYFSKNLLFFGITCFSSIVLIQSTPMVKDVSMNELKQYKNFKKIQIVDDKIAIIQASDDSILRVNIPDYKFFEKNIKTDSPVYFKQSTDWGSIFSTCVSIGFLGLLYLMFSRNNYQSILQFGKSMEVQKNITTRFSDIIGQRNSKLAIQEYVDILKNNSKYTSLGVRVPKGAIFSGPPGTGKTLLAKAIAGESQVPFINITGSEFNAIFVGVGSAKVKNLYDTARKVAKEEGGCIIFIDEIDAIGQKRSSVGNISGGMNERENTLNQLLAEMDGFDNGENIMTFGATNRPDVLDSALLRPGRFDRKLKMDLPNLMERKELFDFYMNKLRLQENTTISEISHQSAKMTPGFSGADISNIVNESGIFCVRKGKQNIEEEDIKDAIDYVMMGAKTTDILTEAEKRIVAYHEAGHAYLSYILNNVENPVKVSIEPREKGMLGFSQSETSDNKLLTKNAMGEKINVLMAGRIAEDIFCKDITNGASDDIEKATTLAKLYVKNFGFDSCNSFMTLSDSNSPISPDSALSNFVKDYSDKAVFDFLRKKYTETEKIVRKSEKNIEKLKDLLLEKETIYFQDIQQLYER
jgi:ATP-dependent metalloprotease FtsH